MRALGVDLGGRRIGIAVSDSDGRVASPIEVLERSGTRREDHRRLARLAAEWEAEVIVVGVPLSLDGATGPAATAVLEEIDELRQATGLTVATVDERFTTVEAERQMRSAGMNSRKGRRVVDMVAASVLLQAWLDGCPGDGNLGIEGVPEPGTEGEEPA